MMTSARVPGSIRSTTVETPRRAMPIASRAPLAEPLLGRRVRGLLVGHGGRLAGLDLRLAGGDLGLLGCALGHVLCALDEAHGPILPPSGRIDPASHRRSIAGGPRDRNTRMGTMPQPALPADDLYARLSVPTDASPEAIEVAWRALLRRHHPDVAGPERPRAGEADQRRPRLAERPGPAGALRPRARPAPRDRAARRRAPRLARPRWRRRRDRPAPVPRRSPAGGPGHARSPGSWTASRP